MLSAVPPEIGHMIFSFMLPYELRPMAKVVGVPSYMLVDSWEDAIAHSNIVRALIHASTILPPLKPLDIIRIFEKVPNILKIKKLRQVLSTHVTPAILVASACGDLESIPEEILIANVGNLLRNKMGGRACSLFNLRPEWVSRPSDEILEFFLKSKLSVRELLRYFPSEWWKNLGDTGCKLRELQGKPFRAPEILSYHDSRHLAQTNGPHELTLEATSLYPTPEGNCWRIKHGFPARKIYTYAGDPWNNIINPLIYCESPEEEFWNIGLKAFLRLDKSYYEILRNDPEGLHTSLMFLLGLPARGGIEASWRFYEDVLLHLIVVASASNLYPILEGWPPVKLNACATAVVSDLDVKNLLVSKVKSDDRSLLYVCSSPRVHFHIHNRARLYITNKKYIL